MKTYRDIILGIATLLALLGTCSFQEQNFFQKASITSPTAMVALETSAAK